MESTLATRGALTGKIFKELNPDNEKIGKLNKQLDEMGHDFEEMKRAKDEARKQLEARFQDVHRKLDNTKEFIVSEGKRINSTLLAFQSKFENELKIMDTRLQEQHNVLVVDINQRFVEAANRSNQLEEMIIQEREERLRQTDEQLRPIRAKLVVLEEAQEVEKNTRVQREKEILQQLSDEVYKLNEKLDNEATERRDQAKRNFETLKYDIKQQEKLTHDFHAKAIEEFHHVTNNIESEMNNRFNHQDKVVDNLSTMVRTFQNTLKVIGAEP
jgi:chromosome segregation ATPase